MLKYTFWYIALLIPLLSKIQPQAVTCLFDSCGTSNDKFKDFNVAYSPDPPIIGKDVTIFISGNLTEQVDKGEIWTKAFFGTRQILNSTFDLCHNLRTANLSCPLHPGPLKFMLIFPIPQLVPPGRYAGEATCFDQNHNVLFCHKGTCSV